MKVGILGGTFDPPHTGHLSASRFALEAFGLDRVELVPTFLPPHKPDRPLSSPFHRYAMAALATLGEERMRASFRELVRGGVSYTIQTLREAREASPGAEIAFILGTDQFAEIATWREPQAIVEEFGLIVMDRPGHTFEDAAATLPEYVRAAIGAGRIRRGGMVPVSLSSSEIRRRVSADESISGLVAPPIAQYIHGYGLYRSDRSGG